MNVYSIKTADGKEVAKENQIYLARALAQAKANELKQATTFYSRDGGTETFSPKRETFNLN